MVGTGRSVWVNTSEPSETVSAPSETVSEDGEPTSLAESVKSLFKRNKNIIIGSGLALVAVTGAFIGLKDHEGATGPTEDFGPPPSPVATDKPKRQDATPHTVREHQRRTKEGTTITIPQYARGGATV
jgi:hypothetical protein